MRIWAKAAYFAPRWSALRAVGNSPAVKLSALFPFVGYLLTFSDLVFKYIAPTGSYIERFTDPMWSLKILYLGLFFVGLASIIYSWKCPNIIKAHSSPSDFFASDKLFYTNHATLTLLLRRKGVPKSIRDKFSFFELNNADVSAEHASSLAGIMAFYYNELDNSERLPRIVSSILYVAGFTLMVIPGFTTFVNVMRNMIGFS
jgi:hypothetical protein